MMKRLFLVLLLLAGARGVSAQNLSYDASGNARIVVYFGANAWATATTGVPKVGVVGSGGAVIDFAGQNATSPANSFLIGGQFNTAPTTITSGNSSPLQLDSAGNLLVNIKAGAGSGGTAIADNAAFTQGTTNETPMSGLYTTAYTAATSGHSTVARMSSGGELFVSPTSGGAALFPAAGALADGTANPTTTGVAAYLFGFNGTTWDRIHPATDATVASTAPTSGPMLALYGNSSAPTAVTAGQAQYGWGDLSGRLHITGDASMGKLLVTPDANSAINVAQVNGATTSTAASGVQKVGVVGNAGAAFDAATGAAPPANALAIGGLASGATGGLMKIPPVCDTDAVINISTATTTRIITGVSGRKVHICGFYLGPNGSAQTVAIIEGTQVTTACDTGAAGMYGGTTAATGLSAAANGGVTIMGGGVGDAMTTATAGDDVCLVTGSAVQTSGHVKYAIY